MLGTSTLFLLLGCRHLGLCILVLYLWHILGIDNLLDPGVGYWGQYHSVIPLVGVYHEWIGFGVWNVGILLLFGC